MSTIGQAIKQLNEYEKVQRNFYKLLNKTHKTYKVRISEEQIFMLQYLAEMSINHRTDLKNIIAI